MMQPRTRRIVQAVLYETIAVVIVTPILTWLFAHPPLSAFALSAFMSGIALAWNYVFNLLYERWEAAQVVKGRTLWRRVVHGVAFEGGLALILIPVMALWLEVSLIEALLADIGIVLFFFFYTVAFTWVFDRVFGLPQSALPRTEGG